MINNQENVTPNCIVLEKTTLDEALSNGHQILLIVSTIIAAIINFYFDFAESPWALALSTVILFLDMALSFKMMRFTCILFGFGVYTFMLYFWPPQDSVASKLFIGLLLLILFTAKLLLTKDYINSRINEYLSNPTLEPKIITGVSSSGEFLSELVAKRDELRERLYSVKKELKEKEKQLRKNSKNEANLEDEFLSHDIAELSSLKDELEKKFYECDRHFVFFAKFGRYYKPAFVDVRRQEL